MSETLLAQGYDIIFKELDRYVRVKIATSTLRTIRKNGLDETAKKYGVDLSKF